MKKILIYTLYPLILRIYNPSFRTEPTESSTNTLINKKSKEGGANQKKICNQRAQIRCCIRFSPEMKSVAEGSASPATTWRLCRAYAARLPRRHRITHWRSPASEKRLLKTELLLLWGITKKLREEEGRGSILISTSSGTYSLVILR